MLLLDTCGEGAGVAVSAGDVVLTKENLSRGGGSAEIVSAVQQVLERSAITLAELDAIGVVSGPGSFTGVRVGMAAAKGLAEASGTLMVAVSRLVVLAEAAHLTDGIAALDAGRGECYAVVCGELEWLGTIEYLITQAGGREIVVSEEKLLAKFKEAAPEVKVRMHLLKVEDALAPLLRLYREQRGTMVLADANYLRRESDIYKLRRESDIYKKNAAHGA
jgi:tRNA threonylcarbamoyladenosine biosynthesis protein TsaB